MSRKKIGATVYLAKEQVDDLKLLNEKTRIPVSVFVREGIDLVLEKYKDQLSKPILETQDALAGD